MNINNKNLFKGKILIVSWCIGLIPIVISFILSLVYSVADKISYIVPWGLLGMAFKAIFDFIFNLPMRIGYSGMIKPEEKGKRVFLLCLAIFVGTLGVVMII